MALVSEIDLPHLPVDDPAFRADPFAAVEQARKKHPWLATTDYGLLIHGYQAIKDIIGPDAPAGTGFRISVEGSDEEEAEVGLNVEDGPLEGDLIIDAGQGVLVYLDEEAADLLEQVLPTLHKIGGSHAQRDLFEQIYLDSLIRAGRSERALALIGRRLAARPNIAHTRRLAQRLAT